MAGLSISAKRPKNLAGSSSAVKCGSSKALNCAQRIEAATVHTTKVSMTEKMVQDAEALFTAHDSEGTALLSRGALTELLRQVGVEAKMGEAFSATARLAFDAHSADSHFLSLPEFKQLYYVVNQRYPMLLPRKPFLRIHVYSASGLPPADFNGKSDPFVVMQIPGKPQSKSQTTVCEKTLDPVFGKPGIGEEFYDKYAYEEGDILEFVVYDYDKGTTDFEVLGRCKLRNEDFHKPGGFHSDIVMRCPESFGKAWVERPPSLKVKVIVNALENEEDEQKPLVRSRERIPSVTGTSGPHGKDKFKVAANMVKMEEKMVHTLENLAHIPHHAAEQHGEGPAAPAGA